MRLTKLPKWHAVFSLVPSSRRCKTPRFQTSGYVTIPTENFSLVGYEKDPVRKGGCWFSLRASHPLFSL